MRRREKQIDSAWKKPSARKHDGEKDSTSKTFLGSWREWLNTLISSLAFVVAIGSAYFTYEANQLHAEHLTLDQRQSDTCEVRYYLEDPFPHIDLCWDFLVSNQSEDKAVITSIHFKDIDIKKYVDRLAKQTAANHSVSGIVTFDGQITTPEGKKINELVKLDGGDAAPLIARLDMPLDDREARLLRRIFGETDGTINSTDFMRRALLQALMEQQVNKKADLDWITLCGYLNDFADDNRERCRKHFEVEITTARGTKKTLLMTLPMS